MAKSFDRTPAAPAGDAEDEPSHCMHRFTLYKTTSRYYIVGSDISDRAFRILKLSAQELQAPLQ